MKSSTSLALVAIACAIVLAPLPSFADSAGAICEVRKDGETKKGRSGPCQFSQSQGNVYLNLKNGEKWELKPIGRDKFRDQKGNTVVRKVRDNTHEYKWDTKKIIVSFD